MGPAGMNARAGSSSDVAAMPRRLSSAQTFFTKIVFPVLWIVGFGTVTLFLRCPTATKVPFLAVWMLGSVLIYQWCVRLKRVSIDDSFLYVSNYLREVRVPLRDVVAVGENRWVNSHPVTITLRSVTEFGDRIVFMPKVRPFGLWSSHPVVAAIREAVDRANGRRPAAV
jgi:hypothetical protein